MFSKTLAFAALSAVSVAMAQIVGTVTLAPYTPSTIQCGINTCPISGEWVSVNQTFFNSYGCGTLVRLTTTDGTHTTVAPVCDVCSTCTESFFEVPFVVLGELGGGSAELTVNYDI
ncbi:hypothetical protein BOTBODRAFT_188321 [Botryobasidium botryosum FD-172 SS1]|uniref:RlpA-like protein double-psi beta-barrel domain-containing protein n=1 Tax=Botryobasidium botryosum (strain FD-172 SS1) TaxID=930990 RepID=A0A067MPU3_BOTB1|nr:hypothetical protein BOTBODRAFT_188321 [Botryobasidium botryosum FD-172 SS1]